MKKNLNPYTTADLKLINDELRRLNSVVALVQKCHDCGIDMAAFEANRQAQVELLTNIKNQFFDANGAPLCLDDSTDGTSSIPEYPAR